MDQIQRLNYFNDESLLSINGHSVHIGHFGLGRNIQVKELFKYGISRIRQSIHKSLEPKKVPCISISTSSGFLRYSCETWSNLDEYFNHNHFGTTGTTYNSSKNREQMHFSKLHHSSTFWGVLMKNLFEPAPAASESDPPTAAVNGQNLKKSENEIQEGQLVMKENGSGDWQKYDESQNSSKNEKEILQRSVKEGINELMHFIIKSSISSGYLKFQNPASNCENFEESIEFLLEMLESLVGAHDIFLSIGGNWKSIHLFLHGFKEIVLTIKTLIKINPSPSSTNNKAFEGFEGETEKELEILEILGQIRSSLSTRFIEHDERLKLQFLKIQCEALLLCTTSSSVCNDNFELYLNNLASSIDELDDVDFDKGNFDLGWESLEYYGTVEKVKRKYLYILQDNFNQDRLELRQRMKERCSSKNGIFNLEFWIGLFKSLNKRKWNYKKSTATAESQSKDQDSKKEKESADNETDKTKSDAKEKKKGRKVRLFRNPASLIPKLANHVLKVSISRVQLFKMILEKEMRLSTFTPLLKQVLLEQISGMDISLSAELFSSIKLFLFGYLDTLLSFSALQECEESINKSKCTNSTDNTRDLVLYSNFIKEIQQVLESLKGKGQERSSFKTQMLIIQFEAILLWSCPFDNELFEEFSNSLKDSIIKILIRLEEDWTLKLFLIDWDKCKSSDFEEEGIFLYYWKIIKDITNC